MTREAPRDPAAWRRANELFHLALDRPAADRDAFLTEACGQDSALRADVQSLLTAHAEAGEFLEGATVLTPDSQHGSDAGRHLIGRQVGQYRIDRVLGRGGMGVVYLAEDLRLGRPVALKAVSPEYLHDPARRERLRREARAAAGLTHPGIATVYAFEEFGDDVFIAGEYVAGETLREEIARGQTPVAQAIETAIGIASALGVAHDRGIVHRDLKPENVIRTPSGQVKILDFGLARLRDTPAGAARLTDDGAILGTPAYMAPEQIRREHVDGRADLFALGIMLHELVTGVHPFAGRDAASTLARILETDAPGLSASGAGPADDRRLVTALDAIVRTCLRKAPAARFSSAHALLAALEHARTGSSPGVPFGTDPADSPLRWWKFHQAATSVCYAALMIPLWWARGWVGGRLGLVLFLAGLVPAVTAVVLRLHLWFAVSSLPAESAEQRVRSRPWLRSADILLVGVLLVAGAAAGDANGGVAGLLVSAAVAVLLGFAIIEPATTRAAFGRR